MEEHKELVQEEQVEVPEVEAAVKETPKPSVDDNWAQARAVLKAQKEELEMLKYQMQQQQLQQKKAEIVEVEDEIDKLPHDELLTKAQAQKLADKRAEKIIKQRFDEYEKRLKENEQARLLEDSETRARGKFDDYDYVVENFALPLIKSDPAFAYQVKNSKDPALAAYKLGKLSDAYEDHTTKQSVSPKAEKVLKNVARPVSGNAINTSLKGQADMASNMSAQQIWEQSQRYAKGGL